MRMLKITFILIMSTLTIANALTLDAAKNKGLVKESVSGYLEAKGEASADVKKLIDSINKDRRELYQGIADRLNIDIQEVEKDAGAKNTKTKGEQNS